MPLLQAHMAGQEPEERVQVGACAASPWPVETVGVTLESYIAAPPPRLLLGKDGTQAMEEAPSLPGGARTRVHTGVPGTL